MEGNDLETRIYEYKIDNKASYIKSVAYNSPIGAILGVLFGGLTAATFESDYLPWIVGTAVGVFAVGVGISYEEAESKYYKYDNDKHNFFVG